MIRERRMAKKSGRTINVERIMAGLEEVVQIESGHADPARVYRPTRAVDVRSLRKALHMTQAQFAGQFGLAVGTIRDWEQGRAAPDGPARVLLAVVQHDPEAVKRALEADAGRDFGVG